MRKIILFIAVVLFAVGANAQEHKGGSREPVAFAKEKIAKMAKYVEITKEDSTKLQKIYVDYQKEATEAISDKAKLMEIMKGLQVKLETVLGPEKYKAYKEKSAADPANKRGMHR